jgi:hypothetical protein
MQIFNGNKLVAQPSLLITRQKGISLIPALITICIFTLLTTQIIIPNQIRNTNEAFINSMAKSAEKLEQASLAFYANKGAWPKSIKPDLVPDFLPVFNEVTDTGYSWEIIEVITIGSGLAYNKPANWSGTRSGALLVGLGDHKLAEAVVNKIGAHAVLSTHVGPFNPRFPQGDDQLEYVLIQLVNPGPVNLSKLIVDDIRVKKNIIVEKFLNIQHSSFQFSGKNIPASSLPGGSSSGFPNGFSSQTFKNNIQPLSISTKSIYQLKPVSFDYKDAFKHYKTPNAANKEIGLIAEQALPLVPELTLVKDDKVMGVDYQKLSILLLKAIQELRTEVTSLQQNNQQLQKQMDNLSKTGTVEDISAMSSVK